MTKELLRKTCERINAKTNLNLCIEYAYGTQRIVNIVNENGACSTISKCGTKKEIANILETIENILHAMEKES